MPAHQDLSARTADLTVGTTRLVRHRPCKGPALPPSAAIFDNDPARFRRTWALLAMKEWLQQLGQEKPKKTSPV